MVDPPQGVKGQGHCCKCVGRYRLIFIPYHQQRTVEISAILLRDESTYR
jgi:hypothetical protein